MKSEDTSWLCVVVSLICGMAVDASAFGVGDTVKVVANTNVRTGPGTSYAEITDPDYPGTARAGTVGKITAGPQNANGYTWWTVDFGPGLYTGWAVQDGLQATAPSQPAVARVALTLYVYEGSVSGPLILGARVTGQDGGGSNFDQTTNMSGYVTIYGTPGTWRFTAAKDSYQPNSWSQDISSTCTKYAFLQKSPTPPQLPKPPTLGIPTPTSPGAVSEPGPVVDTLTPTLRWTAVPGADYYALAISEYPYGPGHVVHNPQRINGSSYAVPTGVLKPGKKYRWNMQAHSPAGFGDVSASLYFQTKALSPVVSSQQSNNMVVDAAMAYIRPHEGYEEKAYQDSNRIWTVGVGFNLQDPAAYKQLKRVGAEGAASLVKEGKFSQVTLDKTTAENLFRLMVSDCVEKARDIWRRVYRTQPTYANFDNLPLDAKLVALDMIYQLAEFETKQWYGFFPPFDETIIPKTYAISAERLETHDDLKGWRAESGMNRVRDHVNKLRELDKHGGQNADTAKPADSPAKQGPATPASQGPTTSQMNAVNPAGTASPPGSIGKAVDYPPTNPAHYKNVFTAGYRGYCTWYAAERWLWARDTVTKGDHVEIKGQGRIWDPREELPSKGPAATWLQDAESRHLLHVDYAKPVKGSIAVFGTTSNNSAGHVAYVESVDEKARVFVFSQMNAGSNLDPKTLKTEYFNKITMDSLKIGATIYKGMKVLGFIYPPDYPAGSTQTISDKTGEKQPSPSELATVSTSSAKPPDSTAKPQAPAAEKPPEAPKFRQLTAAEKAEAEKLWKQVEMERGRRSRLSREAGKKRMVDLCRQIIRQFPDSEYAFKAKQALAGLSEKDRQRYGVTSQEIQTANR